MFPQPAPAPVAKPAPAVPAAPPAPVESPTPAPGVVMAPKELFQTHVRYLKPAARLQLARMILDDLARAM